MLAIRIVKDTFIKFYDELFKYVIINIIWFSLLILPFLLLYINKSNFIFIFVAIYLLFIAGPITLSGLGYINNILNRGETAIKKFFLGIKENFKKGIIAFLFTAIIYSLLIIDIIFFLQRSQNYIMLIIGILFFYIFIVFSMMQIYFWGLLTVQVETAFWQVVKRSLLLVLDNLIPTILVLLFLIIIIVLNFVLSFIMPFLFFTLISLIAILSTKYILEQYETE